MSGEPIISVEQGEAFGKAYIQNLHECFMADDMTSNKALTADVVEWNWSGGVAGKGPQEEYYKVLAGSWQMVVSQFLPSNVFVVTDPMTGTICIAFEVTLIMDGRGAVPINDASTFQGKNVFELTVNKDHKVACFRGIWDPINPKMGAAFGAVVAAKK